MTDLDLTSTPLVRERLTQLESAVWASVAARRRKAQRVTAMAGMLAFAIVSAGSYSVGSMQSAHRELHFSMAAELSQGDELLHGWAQ